MQNLLINYMVVISFLLFVFLLAACILSRCHSKVNRGHILLATSITSQASHSAATSQRGQCHSNDQLVAVSTEDIGLNQFINQPNPLFFYSMAVPPQSLVTALDPPPYHTAILMPQQTHPNHLSMQGNEESPPPSYDKVVS
ncbi:hypothetical protein R5R35_009890 [Gryllus longicercus]|uniref:Uncharacterized protein n=1 Tax=Gryllus longicercus TaxID=2509291 RepID=A0AAN9VSR0_9ORTH